MVLWYSGPEQVSICMVPYCPISHILSHIVALPENTPKLTKLGICHTCQHKFESISFFKNFFGLFWLYWQYSFKRVTGNRVREGTQQKSLGWESNPGPLQSLGTWVVRATNQAKRLISNLLFQTLPRKFHQFAWSFAHSICGPTWQNVVKKILIFQTILFKLKDFLSVGLTWNLVQLLSIPHDDSCKRCY